MKYTKGMSKIGYYILASSVVFAFSVTAILGGGVEMFGSVLLATVANVFIVPVALLTEHFAFPVWVWYLIVLSWVTEVTLTVTHDDRP